MQVSQRVLKCVFPSLVLPHCLKYLTKGNNSCRWAFIGLHMSCPWIIAMISTGYLTQAWGILAIMSVTSVVIGNIVRTELADIFVHFSVRGRQFSDIAISKYINGFNVFSKTTCDPDAIYSDLLQRRCGQRGKLPVLSLIQVWHHPHTSHQWRLQQSVNIVSPGCGLTPCLDPSDASLWKLAVRLHLKEAAGHGSALTFDLCLLSLW